jgi:hypothetical protein
MKEKVMQRQLPRGRIAHWSREQLAALSTLELRQLFLNAQRLNETELATTCDEILGSRPQGRPRAPRSNRLAHLVTWQQAAEMHGVSLRSRRWSRGGIRSDGAVVVGLSAGEVHTTPEGDTYLLWAPNDADDHPWSDTPGGQERLEHCRIAHERGAAEGLLTYSKRTATGATPEDEGISTIRVNAAAMLSLRIEKRGEEYWATLNGRTRTVHDVK